MIIGIENTLKITSLKELREVFKPVFIELYPTLSSKSFNYHFSNYIDNILKQKDDSFLFCDSIEDELERFKWYVSKIYNN